MGKMGEEGQKVLTSNYKIIKSWVRGHLGGSVVEHLPSAQVVVPGLWDRVPHQAPFCEPASLSAYVPASHSVSLMNK